MSGQVYRRAGTYLRPRTHCKRACSRTHCHRRCYRVLGGLAGCRWTGASTFRETAASAPRPSTCPLSRRPDRPASFAQAHRAHSSQGRTRAGCTASIKRQSGFAAVPISLAVLKLGYSAGTHFLVCVVSIKPTLPLTTSTTINEPASSDIRPFWDRWTCECPIFLFGWTPGQPVPTCLPIHIVRQPSPLKRPEKGE